MSSLMNIYNDYAYNFYPRGISNPFEQEYLSSEEYLTLLFAIDKARDWRMDKVITSLMTVKTGIKNTNQTTLNLTNFNFGDRCFHVQYSFYTEHALQAISVNISILAPIFCVYYVGQDDLDNEFVGRRITNPEEFQPYDFEYMPKKYHALKEKLVQLVKDFGYHFVANDALGNIIPDISYETIGINNMTVFNAFFLNKPYCNM